MGSSASSAFISNTVRSSLMSRRGVDIIRCHHQRSWYRRVLRSSSSLLVPPPSTRTTLSQQIRRFHHHHDDETLYRTEEEKGSRPSPSLSPVREFFVVRHGETDYNKELRIQGVTDIPLNQKGRLQAQLTSSAIKHQISSMLTDGGSSKTASSNIIKIYTSVMSRAAQTGDAIFEAFRSQPQTLSSSSSSSTPIEPISSQDFKIAPIERRSELNEWNLGSLEGLRKDDAIETFPIDWEIFSKWADPYVSPEYTTQRIQNGESMEDVRIRVVDVIEQAVFRREDEASSSRPSSLHRDENNQDGPNTINVFVSHGAVLGQLLRHAVTKQYDNRLGEPSSSSSNNINAVLSESMTSQQQQQQQFNRPKNACITKFSINRITKEWIIISWADHSHLIGDAAPMGTNYSSSNAD